MIQGSLLRQIAATADCREIVVSFFIAEMHFRVMLRTGKHWGRFRLEQAIPEDHRRWIGWWAPVAFGVFCDKSISIIQAKKCGTDDDLCEDLQGAVLAAVVYVVAGPPAEEQRRVLQ